MRGMSFLAYRQFLRDTSKKADCILMCKSSKGILIDANGKWEVKYCSKNHQHKSQYTLVGWFDTEEEAVRAYNETALQHGDERAIVRSFFKKKTGYARVASPTRDDSGTTIENTERTFPLAHPASNNSQSSKEEVTSASHPRASCWERATDASKRDASGSMEACARDDKNDDTEMHDASVNVPVLPQQADGSSLSDPDELEGTHRGTILSSNGSKGLLQMNDAAAGPSNIPEEIDPPNPSNPAPHKDAHPSNPDPCEDAHRDEMGSFSRSSGMLQENHLHSSRPNDSEQSQHHEDGCFRTGHSDAVLLNICRMQTIAGGSVLMNIYRIQTEGGDPVILSFLQHEGYNHLQMQEECQGRSQFTESDRALQCVDAEFTLFNLFPGGTPLDYSLEVPTFDFFPAEPLSTDNQDVNGLTHLKMEGPFDVDLTL
ncbi:hypothetical protein MPTK1_6g16780 [Marchantia polymorpha subsp. ruderalis]|uniref:AP2/ERF domain-containing protein n=1 Tax=Marchantia polymorpha subsp. ruderalis TaxID=1480154 RepID=A0AAF6BSU2_MARPO|nr:hypothetical protein Mp_6g16780 [Marchantia polymorpha subsp. ruderalis]